MNAKPLYFLAALFLILAACAPQAFPPPDPTAAPTPTPDAGPDFSRAALTLTSEPFRETGAGPDYTISAQIPQLAGSDDARVTAFNDKVKTLVMNEIDKFRADVLAHQPVEKIVAGSSLDAAYTLINESGGVWSFKFDFYYYFDGAAHPSSYSLASNYDVLHGKALTLDDVFSPDSNYLQFIADFCKAELAKRDIGFNDPAFQSGADPTPENYRVWNLAQDGLTITFDVYQVAPYVAGPQSVTIPYAALRPFAYSNGPLLLFDK